MADRDETERLAKLADARATRAESEAGDCRRDIADESMSDYSRGLSEDCLSSYEAEARDWREIASRLRAAPEVAEPDIREKAQALVDALDRCQPAIDGAFCFISVHGRKYDGPTYNSEREALRAALRSPRIEKAERDGLIGAMNRIYNRAWLSITDHDERMSLKADGEALSAFVYAALPSPRIEGDER